VSEQVQITSRRGGITAFLGRFPWALLVILYPVAMYELQIDMEAQIHFGFIYIGLGVFVLFVEFFKSGDINAISFLLDLLWSVLALVVGTALMTWFLLEIAPASAGAPGWQQLNYFHWFGCAIILGDAIISPFNSFRTALRNFGVGGSV
jgi:hypothetical protein